MLMHDGQLTISVAAVRELLCLQFPQWQSLPIRAVASDGTVNAIFRIGARLAARFPLQPADVAATRQWLESEASAARRLIGRTRFRTPEPVAIGEPGAGYPLPWSVQTWLPAVATEQDQSRSVTFARDLADFVGEVRAIDTEGRTFAGTNRGGDLRSRDVWMEECFTRSEGLFDVAWLRRTWQELRSLPRTAADVMTHGDLIPGNLLVAHGRLTGSTRCRWPGTRGPGARSRRRLARVGDRPAARVPRHAPLATTWNGPAAPRGPSNKHSEQPGTTRTATRR